MLKPWIVQTLIFAYKTGLLLTLALSIALGHASVARLVARRLTPNRLRAAIAVFLLGVALAGYAVGFSSITFAVLLASAIIYLWVANTKYLRIFVPIPLGILIMVGSLFLDNQHNVNVVRSESPLAPGLVCRTYGRHFDSIDGTRLVVARTGRCCLFDRSVEGPAIPQTYVLATCTLAPPNSVAMKLQSRYETEYVTVNLP